MPEPLVSVKMITYNHGPYIAQAIEGVLQQKVSFPIELVIGEDCSTDGTREIVFDYQKRHPDVIRVITSDRNVGARTNGRRTEKACRGKYVAYCEGDDYWHHPLKLQKQVDYMEAHPECGVVHSDADIYYVNTGQRVSCYNRSRDKVNRRLHAEGWNQEQLFARILDHSYRVISCTTCFNRGIMNSVLGTDPVVFESDRFMMGDTPRWLEMARVTRFGYLDEALATYQRVPRSMTCRDDGQKWMEFRLSIYDMVVYYARKYGCTDRSVAEFADMQAKALLSMCFEHRNAAIARQVASIRGRLSPRQQVLYWGTVSPVFHAVLWPVVRSYQAVRGMFAPLHRGPTCTGEASDGAEDPGAGGLQS